MNPLRALELGNYVVPAYAGMILAEQGHAVEKWTNGKDPILDCHRGGELWAWINHGKRVVMRHPRELPDALHDVDMILDNFRPAAWEAWKIDPAVLARRHRLVWVSVRSEEENGRSFDLVAQARAWMDFSPWVPFWIGDTAAGLWLAFKALAAHAAGEPGHYILGQASLLAKLVEGELILDAPRGPDSIPWESSPYYVDRQRAEAVVVYKGQEIREPIRDRQWKLANLWHRAGRITV